MDILAARKKAAERVKARNKPDPEEAAQAAQPTREEATPASPGSRPNGIAGSPVAASAAPVIEAPRDTTGSSPAASSGGPEETQQRELELLSFSLGGEEYAVMVADVREVLRIFQPTTVPNAPDYILGVMSLRGTMLPIIDLCKRFGLASGVKDAKSRIIVVNSDDGEAGLLVDRVTGVFRILPDEIKPAPENIEQGAEFLRGIARKDDRLYILLDLEKAVGV